MLEIENNKMIRQEYRNNTTVFLHFQDDGQNQKLVSK